MEKHTWRVTVDEVTVEMMIRESSLHIAPAGHPPEDAWGWIDLGLAPTAAQEDIDRAISRVINHRREPLSESETVAIINAMGPLTEEGSSS